MRRALLALTAVGGGALAYFLDPRLGRRRRHVARDKAESLARQGGRRGRRLVRHLRADATGAAHRLRNRVAGDAKDDLDDKELAHKVESIVFRDRKIPKGRISVNAERGVVFLRGEVDRVELLEELEARVRKVQGVRGVENRLHLPDA